MRVVDGVYMCNLPLEFKEPLLILYVDVVCSVRSGLGRRSLVYCVRSTAALQYDSSL